jgi:hypothetical protein
LKKVDDLGALFWVGVGSQTDLKEDSSVWPGFIGLRPSTSVSLL